MEFPSSVAPRSSQMTLVLQLISSAFQRCRVSENLCRLSVVLKGSASSGRPLVLISISDTGVGSCLEEFQGLRFHRERDSTQSRDVVLSIKFTSSSDTEIYHYHLNLSESTSSRRMTSLPSISKNGAKFSGTEASLSISGRIDLLQADIENFFQKMLVLKIPNVAIELVAGHGDDPGSQYTKVFLANDFNPLPFTASCAECLKSGLGDYVLRHGNSLNKKCDFCFPSCDHLKIGSGIVCSTERGRSSTMVMEAVLIISKRSQLTSPCFSAYDAKTEVLYFRDFSPSSLSQSCLNTLACIDWKSYGLTLGCIGNQSDRVIIEWENLPLHAHIDIALHFYDKKVMLPPPRKKTQLSCNIMKKCLKLALDDLKENHAGLLLSAQALRTLSYVPDLAQTIAGLILSSNDSEFQEECFSLLGLHSPSVSSETVQDCIKEKITSVVEMNDRKPQRSKEVPTLLFEEGRMQEPYLPDELWGESEDAATPF